MARYTRTWFLLAAIAVALVPGSCADDSTTTSDAESAGTPVDEPTLVSRGLEVAADGDGVRLSGGGASLRLRSVLPVELGAFEAAGDSLSRSNADGFGELWDAVGSGVRQSWYFPNDPSPGDDLVVTIEIEEGRALARTREGTIIGSKETGPFAYSDALWIGADGQQTPIRAAYLDSSIELRVPATVVEDTEFPAWLDPTVSAPLDPFVPVPTLTIVFPLQPSISCNASRCRIGFDLDESSGNVNFERRAMVVDTNGLVQTPISSLVATGLTNNVTASEARRSIANIGSTFLVVWREGTSTVRAQRFTETGAPLDATSFVVGTDACNCSTGGPSVTASDTSFMVAWGTTSTGLKGRLIDVNGQFASSVVEILAPTTNGLSTAPEVASDGNGFAIGFDNANTGARIITTSPTLALTANTFLGPSSHFGGARVAWDGTSYVVGWLNASNAWVRRVSSIGAPLAPASDLGPAGAIRLACRTGDCLVTMYSSNNLLGQPLLTGVPAGGPIVITPLSNYMAHDITTNGSDYQLLWYTGNLRMSPVTLQGVLEIPGGAPVEYVGNNLGGFVTTTPAGNLALARTGSTCVSAFISANGVPGPEATLAGSCSIAPVGLLEEGSDAFLHSDGVSTRILDATASPVTPMVGTTDPGELGSDAYWNGGDFMLLNDASGAQTALKRFSTAGQLVGGTVLFPGTSPRGTGTPAGGLVTAIVSGNQTIRAVDPTGVVVSPVTALGASTVAGDVAWGSVNGGVTWASSTSVLFQRIDQAAVPLDAFAFTVASTQTAPRIAWDGNGYVVAYRSPTTNAIRARRMKADGTADGGDFSVAIPRSTFLGVVAVPGAPSARAAVYSSGNRPELHASRLILAYVDSDAIDGTPCAGNASCQSGLCVDGVCCAAACGGGVDDCQACSVASGGQLDGQCTPLAAPATMVCRASAGVCDVPETCAAASTTCPADTFAPSSVECRASSNVCDAAESCTGASAACPADGYLAAGVECRPASDVCDAAESCTGASAACPADGYVAGGVECRAASDICDAAESCTGVSAACPADGYAMAGAPCRAAAGDCDAAETCDGLSSSCPVDVVIAAGTVCRASVGPCDPEETCNGTSTACSSDAAMPPGTPCGGAPSGVCDLQDECQGSLGATAACVDVVDVGAVCRAAVGACDVPEICSAASHDCPADALAPNGTACGADGTCSDGQCDSGAGGSGAGGSGAGGSGAGGSGAGGASSGSTTSGSGSGGEPPSTTGDAGVGGSATTSTSSTASGSHGGEDGPSDVTVRSSTEGGHHRRAIAAVLGGRPVRMCLPGTSDRAVARRCRDWGATRCARGRPQRIRSD